MTIFTKAIITGTFLPAMIPTHTSLPNYRNNPTIHWHQCHPVISPVPPYVTQHRQLIQYRLNAERDPIPAGVMRQPEHKPGFLNKLKRLIGIERTPLKALDSQQNNTINHTDVNHSFTPQTENDLLALYTLNATSSTLWQQKPELSLEEIITTKTHSFPAKNIEIFLEQTLTALGEVHQILLHFQSKPQNEEDIAFLREMKNKFTDIQAKTIHMAHRYACDYWLPTLIQSITPEQINQLFKMASRDEEVSHWASQFLVAIAYLSNSEFSALSTVFINKTLASGVMISPILQASSERKPPSTANLGYLLYAHNHLILSLAGTQPCTMHENLIAHLQFWKGENDLHQGYHQYTQTVIKPSIAPVLKQLMPAIEKMLHNDSQHLHISYAGHSLGASVAAILAVEQWLVKEINRPPQQQSLHINSAARIGGNQAHTQLQKNQIRLYSSTNENDLVFLFPPQFIGFVPLTDTQPVASQNIWQELQQQVSALYQNVGEDFVRHEITTTLFITPPAKIVQLQQKMGLWALPPTIQAPHLLGYRAKI